MSSTATFAPSLASSRAVASPNPDAAPETSAVCPWICMSFSWAEAHSGRGFDDEREGVIVQPLDQGVAVFQDSPLVQRALVGDLALPGGRWLHHKECAGYAACTACRLSRQLIHNSLNALAHRCALNHIGPRGIRRQVGHLAA